MSKREKERPFRTREAFIDYARGMLDAFLANQRREGRYVNWTYARGPACMTGRVNECGQPLYGRGDREGIFLAWEDEDGVLKFGWSLRHPRREAKPFCRVEGLYRAFGRSRTGSIAENLARLPLIRRFRYADFVRNSTRELQEWNNKRLSRATSEAI